jgi:hypothetical protein
MGKVCDDFCGLIDDLIEDEMGGACSAHGGDEKCIQNFGWKDLGVDGRIILTWIVRKWGLRVQIEFI